MPIPKKIHYCWFGGNELPLLAKKCIETWKKHLPDYEIKEWNETNFDIKCCKYVEEAYNEKKWAFVSDYARFYALYQEGGIYFDTDIEVLKVFDDLLTNDVFFGFGKESLTLPVFGAKDHHHLFEIILNDYRKRSFKLPNGELDTTTIERTVSRILIEQYDFKLNGTLQNLDENIKIFPKDFFYSTDWQTGIVSKNPNLYVIHYAEGSWMTEKDKQLYKYRRKYISLFGIKIGSRMGTAAYLYKNEGLDKLIDHLCSFIRRKSAKTFMKVSRMLRKKQYKIVCENFGGKGYGDNPKYIVEELLKRSTRYDIVWLVDKSQEFEFPSGIRTVKTCTFKELYELATAKIWIDNNRKPYDLYKSKDQIYIQTWHGFYPLKKIEKDAEKSLSEAYIKNAKHDGEMTDLMISGCKARTELYKNSFYYSGDILECGTPRNDILFSNKDYRSKINNYFHIDPSTKIVLYCPTFRDNHNLSAYNINYEEMLDAFKKKFGGNWICIVKLHPAVSYKSSLLTYSERVIDVSKYEDIQELFVTCEVMISDYSNCMFEFALTNKPVFIYASDIESYMNTRDFYYDIRQLHFPLSTNNNELIKSIENFDSRKYIEENEKFIKKIGSFEDGKASKCIADYIETKCAQ